MKKTHLDNLLDHIPQLLNQKIIDIGSGRGKFLVEATKKGIDVAGIEFNQAYIDITNELAKENNISVIVKKGTAEDLPFESNQFGFANMCELIEHVEHPRQILLEANRVLQPGGQIYISVPNRFGLKDPHFHLYLVNYLPRFLANPFIGMLGKHKVYHYDAGRQKLTEMHYYTYRQILKLAKETGFEVIDIRQEKIRARFKKPLLYLAMAVYIIARALYFNTFHLRLMKKNNN